jgi:tRNASer (uridine44-2'-O)-methyltransferase
MCDDQDKETRPDTSSSVTQQADDTGRRKYKFTAPVGYSRTRNISRQILPRRPTRDAPLVQDCSFYRSKRDGQGDEQGILVMIPHSDRPEDIPYYHPVLRKLAFRYSSIVPSAKVEPSTAEGDAAPTPEQPAPQGTISISILPFSEDPASQPSTAAGGSTASRIATAGQRLSSDVLPNRTYRTCLHLLETLHKHGWGRLTGYQKRVIHDVRSGFICSYYHIQYVLTLDTVCHSLRILTVVLPIGHCREDIIPGLVPDTQGAP